MFYIFVQAITLNNLNVIKMQENQFHIDLLKNVFPNASVKEVYSNGELCIKAHVQTINREQLEGLFWGVPSAVDINLKRSGTGITVILTNK